MAQRPDRINPLVSGGAPPGVVSVEVAPITSPYHPPTERIRIVADASRCFPPGASGDIPAALAALLTAAGGPGWHLIFVGDLPRLALGPPYLEIVAERPAADPRRPLRAPEPFVFRVADDAVWAPGFEAVEARGGAEACRAWGPGWRVGRVSRTRDLLRGYYHFIFDPEPAPIPAARPPDPWVYVVDDADLRGEHLERLIARLSARAERDWGPGWRVGRVVRPPAPGPGLTLWFQPEPDPAAPRQYAYGSVNGQGTAAIAEPLRDPVPRYPDPYAPNPYAERMGLDVRDTLFRTMGPVSDNNTPLPPPETEAQRTARDESRGVREAALRAQRAAVEARAQALLLSLLTPDQRAQFAATQSFDVVGSAGRRYRIERARNFNVDEVGVGRWCAGPSGSVPLDDFLAGQLLLLRTDEAAFRRIANPGERVLPADPVLPIGNEPPFHPVSGLRPDLRVFDRPSGTIVVRPVP